MSWIKYFHQGEGLKINIRKLGLQLRRYSDLDSVEAGRATWFNFGVRAALSIGLNQGTFRGPFQTLNYAVLCDNISCLNNSKEVKIIFSTS